MSFRDLAWTDLRVGMAQVDTGWCLEMLSVCFETTTLPSTSSTSMWWRNEKRFSAMYEDDENEEGYG